MKKHVLYVSAIISVLSMVGCSRFEDTTGVGSDVLNDIDPAFLDNDKKYTKFDLSTDIVETAYSIPNETDSLYGIHTNSIFPVGGKNGEQATAYYEFKTSFDNWKKVSGIDSLIQFSKIYSTALVFDTVNSSNADCNYSQDVRVFRIKDSVYKYNRNEINVNKILAGDHLSDTGLDISNLKKEFVDTTFNGEILEACTQFHQQYKAFSNKPDSLAYFEKSIFKPKTFHFLVASKDEDKNYAYLKSGAALKVHMIRGEPRKGGSKAPIDTTFSIKKEKSPFERTTNFIKESIYPTTYHYDTLLSIAANPADTFKTTGDTIKNKFDKKDTIGVYTARDTTPLAAMKNNYRSRIQTGDSTFIIDSIAWKIDTLITDTVITHFYSKKIREIGIIDSIVFRDTLQVIRKIRNVKIDSLFDTPVIAAFDDTLRRIVNKVDTIVMKADSFYIPLSYSNYVVYEKSDIITNRKTVPMSSFGPQRTAVFELNLDSLWNKLKEPSTSTQSAFNKILSAGVAITGTYDSTFKKSMTDMSDTTIVVNWCVSEFRHRNGRELFKRDKTWGTKSIDTGREVILPVEKNLQEIMSRSVNPPKTAYLHLEIQSSKHYSKQVIWSKPSLVTVLTTSNQ